MSGFEGESLALLGVKVGTGVFLKAGVVVGSAWLATLLCRRESAAVRCAIWSSALATLILLPFLSAVMPSAEIAQVAPPHGVAAEAPAAGESSPVVPSRAGVGQGRPIAPPEGRSLAGAAPPIAMILLGLWLAGTVGLLLRMLMHGVRVRRIVSRASRCDDPEINSIVAGVSSDLRLTRGVATLISDEVSMAFSCGVLRPKVVLPQAARDWPPERKKSVLLHELAHAARWDYVVHIMTGLVCAIYWPNPLVWFAAKRCAMERERACDDLAVQRTSSVLYAEELLHIARSQIAGMAPIRAVTMAAREDLTERIRSIVSTGIRRNPLPLTGALLICCFTLVLTLPLAAVELLGIEARAAEALGIPRTSNLIRDMRGAEDAALRRRAAWWLGEHEDGSAVPALTRYGLRDKDPAVRLVSAWALGEIKDYDAIDPLIESLKDEDYYVREMAVLALGEIEHPSATEALVGTFNREKALREAVIWALGEIEGETARDTRQAAFELMGVEPWENEEVWTGTLDRGGALWQLGKRRRSERLQDFEEQLDRLRSVEAEDRLDAAFRLGRLGIHDCIETTDVIDPLLDALRDPSPEVRAMAVWALDEFNPSRSRHFKGSEWKWRPWR